MADNEYINKLFTEQRRAFEAQEAMIAAGPMDAEAQQSFDRAQADLERMDAEIKRYQKFEDDKRAADTAREAYEPFIRPTESRNPGEKSERDMLEDFFRGNRRDPVDIDLRAAKRERDIIRQGAGVAELRSILIDGGASGGSLVIPTEWARSIYQYLEAPSAVRQLATVMQSSNGDPWTLPKVVTHGVGTQVIASGTAIGGTDAVLGNITLNAFKYGQLEQVAIEMVQDSAFDIVSFVTANVARAVGRVTAADYAVGTGSGEPLGVVAACTGSVVTGGSLITAVGENLIDLQHAVVQEYRDNGSYIMRDSSLGSLRKLRADGGGTIGPWLLEPPSAPGQPTSLFGRPVYTDFSVAAAGSAASVAVFGDISRYYIKDSGPFRFERSDEYAFNTDLVSFRGVLRTDGDLVDTNAVKVLKQQVA